MKLHTGAATHAGKVRSNNQDRWLVVDQKLFVVADGMGGHRGGEVAAQLTVDVFNETDPTIDSSDALMERVARANSVVLTQSRADPELMGMGTTVTAIAVLPLQPSTNGTISTPTIAIVNVGDSRTYRMRNGELEQLTEDHNVTSELVRTGRITPAEARTHRQRSVLTRAVGVDDDVESDVLEVLVAVDDRFLLCSDGLYGEVPDDLISSLLRRLGDPQEAANELIRTAVARGGRDNVTAVIVDVVDDDNAAWLASQQLVGAQQSDASQTGEPAQVNVRAPTNATIETLPPTLVPGASKTEAKPADRATVEIVSPKKPRRPFFVNLRVLIFIGLLGALGAVVVWAVNQGKKIQISDTTTSSVVVGNGSLPSDTVALDTSADTTPGKKKKGKKNTASTTPTIPIGGVGGFGDPKNRLPTTTTTSTTSTTVAPVVSIVGANGTDTSTIPTTTVVVTTTKDPNGLIPDATPDSVAPQTKKRIKKTKKR
jgi:PPM family protein phosphatase